jgi:holo-[acyl-carrier protein] synthase
VVDRNTHRRLDLPRHRHAVEHDLSVDHRDAVARQRHHALDVVLVAVGRHGERFEQRCFTAIERAKAERRPFTRAGTYAKRFAAKEAFSKAVGTGFFQGVYMKDIGVVNLPSGAPTLRLENGAAKRLAELTPEGHVAHVHLTLTDDHPWAQAFVVIEARPA